MNGYASPHLCKSTPMQVWPIDVAKRDRYEENIFLIVSSKTHKRLGRAVNLARSLANISCPYNLISSKQKKKVITIT